MSLLLRDVRGSLTTCHLVQLTVPILKDFLHAHGRSTAGKKADLVERVEEYYERK